MLDPITTIGLAASIVQLADFTGRLISNSHEFYKSASGALVQHEDLRVVAESLRAQLGGLSRKRQEVQVSEDIDNWKQLYEVDDFGNLVRKPAQWDGIQDDPALQLEKLSYEMDEAASKLLNVVDELRLIPGHRTWSSIRQAVKSILKQHEIQELEERLDRYRKQVDTTLLISLRYVLVNYIHCDNANTATASTLNAYKQIKPRT
jgi:hypothetical protein